MTLIFQILSAISLSIFLLVANVGPVFAKSPELIGAQRTALKSDKSMRSTGSRPGGAFGTTLKLSKGNMFAWQSKTPHQESDAEAVYIVVHGVDRNANDYFSYLNNAYLSARQEKLANAPKNSLRIAPLFFDVSADAQALNDSTLAWPADNTWATGEGSSHPKGSDLSSLSVFDQLVEKYSDRSSYPHVKIITLVGHGGGAILLQRYAALRDDASNPSGISLRFVVGDPSTMLYFTKDRPQSVSSRSCSYYNEYFYGLQSYDIPYQRSSSDAETLFSNYATRDVRYLVALDDTSSKNGDQSCGGRAQGGAQRKNRSLSYWKYIHLLAGEDPSDYEKYPGNFGDIDALSYTKVQHSLYEISGVGHDAASVLSSEEGKKAVFS